MTLSSLSADVPCRPHYRKLGPFWIVGTSTTGDMHDIIVENDTLHGLRLKVIVGDECLWHPWVAILAKNSTNEMPRCRILLYAEINKDV